MISGTRCVLARCQAAEGKGHVSDAAVTRSVDQISPTVLDLEEKCRRVIHRLGRLQQLVEMQAPGIVLRNEKRMIEAAIEDLPFDGSFEAIVSIVGARALTEHLKHIAPIEIGTPFMKTGGGSLEAGFVA